MLIYAEEINRFCGCDRCATYGKECKDANCKYYDDFGEDYTCSQSYEATTKAFYEAKILVIEENSVVIDTKTFDKSEFIKLELLNASNVLTLIEEGQDV